MQGNIIEENVQGGVKRITATTSPIYIAFDGEPVHVEQNFMQRVIAFVKHLFMVLVNGFIGW